MKRVLQISKYMYPFIGGVEQVAKDIANALSEQGYEQKIICFNEDADDGKMVCRKEENTTDFVDGVEVIRVGYKLKIASQSLSLHYKKALDDVMENFKPDVVIFHYANPFVARLLLRHSKENFKLVVYWHFDISKQRFLKLFVHDQTKRLIERADKIVGATPIHVNESEFSKYFGNKKYILPYRIDEKSLILDDIDREKASLIRMKYSGKVLGFFIGRHVPYKGLKYLIAASKELGNINAKFFIAGNGELTESLKAQAAGDDKIEFIGRISASDKRAYLEACDILTFPSVTKNEAFGLALAEGMYFGMPAVTYHINGSGVNYVNLDGVTGIECPNADVSAYANALRKLIEDEELRTKLGTQARERVLENFTAENFKENMVKLLEEEL